MAGLAGYRKLKGSCYKKTRSRKRKGRATGKRRASTGHKRCVTRSGKLKKGWRFGKRGRCIKAKGR